MINFSKYVENRDEEQLRRMGLKPSRMTISKTPDPDFDKFNRKSDAQYINPSHIVTHDDENHIKDREDALHHLSSIELDSDEREEEKSDFNYHAQSVIHRNKNLFARKMLNRLYWLSRKHHDFTLWKSLVKKMIPTFQFADNDDPDRNSSLLYDAIYKDESILNKIDRTDWLMIADWLEENGEDASAMRRYAYKVLK